MLGTWLNTESTYDPSVTEAIILFTEGEKSRKLVLSEMAFSLLEEGF